MTSNGSPRSSFLIGETVHLISRISEPGTKKPTDPQKVQLTSWRIGDTEILDTPVDFVREATGEYALALTTVGMDPGTYSLLVVHSSGPERVAIVADKFVLQSA